MTCSELTQGIGRGASLAPVRVERPVPAEPIESIAIVPAAPGGIVARLRLWAVVVAVRALRWFSGVRP